MTDLLRVTYSFYSNFFSVLRNFVAQQLYETHCKTNIKYLQTTNNIFICIYSLISDIKKRGNPKYTAETALTAMRIWPTLWLIYRHC